MASLPQISWNGRVLTGLEIARAWDAAEKLSGLSRGQWIAIPYDERLTWFTKVMEKTNG